MRYLLTLLAISLAVTVHAQKVEISADSKITFSLKNMGWNTVEGSFSSPSGYVQFNNGQLVGAHGCVEVVSVQTGNSLRDKHLREKEEFFHIEEFPELCFTSSDVSIVRNSSGQTLYKLEGSLTLRGVSKPLEFEFVEQAGGTLIGTCTVDRSLWGLGEGYSNFIIAQNIDVRVELHLNE